MSRFLLFVVMCILLGLAIHACEELLVANRTWIPYHVKCYSGETMIWEGPVEHLQGSWGVNRGKPVFSGDPVCIWHKVENE